MRLTTDALIKNYFFYQAHLGTGRPIFGSPARKAGPILCHTTATIVNYISCSEAHLASPSETCKLATACFCLGIIQVGEPATFCASCTTAETRMRDSYMSSCLIKNKFVLFSSNFGFALTFILLFMYI